MNTSKMKKITSKEAYQIIKKIGKNIVEDGVTFYATNEKETEIYSFDSRSERDEFVNRSRRGWNDV